MPRDRPAIGRDPGDIEDQPPPRQRCVQIDRAKRDIAKRDRTQLQRDLGISGKKPAHIDRRARPTLTRGRAVIAAAGQCQRITCDRATDHRTLRPLGQVKRQRKGGLVKLQSPVTQMGRALIAERDLPR